MDPHKIYAMPFSKVYTCYIEKAENKKHTKAEVDKIICWLSGYSMQELKTLSQSDVTIEQFFLKANLNPLRKLITGVVCGIRVEEVKEPIMREIRYLDKLIDELAKGKAMEKILRKK